MRFKNLEGKLEGESSKRTIISASGGAIFVLVVIVMILNRTFLQFSHLAWVQTDRKSGGLGDLQYPLVSDVTKSISKSYGVLIPDQVCQYHPLLYYKVCSKLDLYHKTIVLRNQAADELL